MQLTKENLGGIVKDTRKALGLTQSRLAEKAGCSQRLISDLERGSGAEFGKVLSVLAALEIDLVPMPKARGGASAVQDLTAQVERSLKAQKPAKPRLDQLL